MGRQRNNPQSKGKEKSTDGVLNEIKASNLSDRVQNNGYKDAQGI